MLVVVHRRHFMDDFPQRRLPSGLVRLQRRQRNVLHLIVLCFTLLPSACYTRQVAEIDPYCLRDSDCDRGQRCVAQFCQRRVSTVATKPDPVAPASAAPAPEIAKTPRDQPRQVVKVKSARLTTTAPRTALIIGNASYSPLQSLRNASNDARLLGETLERVGFKVDMMLDLDLASMRRGVTQFGKNLRKRNGVGLFFFAGHAIEVDGVNYLLPVNTPEELREANVRFQALPVDWVVNEMRYAGGDLNVIIIDACRVNPLPSFSRSMSRGLAPMDVPLGTMSLMAAGPGQVAFDGAGDNGPFTKHLVKQILEPGLPIEQTFKRAAREVYRETGDRQQPELRTNYYGDFFFVPE